MKKLFLLGLCMLGAMNLTAQSTISSGKTGPALTIPAFPALSYKTQAIDTVWDYLYRAKAGVLIQAVTGGYVMGTSWIPDSTGAFMPVTEETGNHYTYGGTPVSVTELLSWVGRVNPTGSPDTLKSRVYLAGTDSMPTTLIGTGWTLSSSLNPSFSFVLSSIPLTQISQQVTGDFFVGLNYADWNDTLGLVSSHPDSGDGLGEERPRQFTADFFGNEWRKLNQIWVGGFDCDPFILPVIDDTPLDLAHPLVQGNFSYQGCAPNPSSGQVNFSFQLGKASTVRLVLFDLQGRALLREQGLFSAGSGQMRLDVSGLPAGTYYYHLATPDGGLTSKLNVLH